MKKVLNVLAVLFGLWFINAGLNKIFEYLPMPEDIPQAMIDLMEHMEALGWLIPLVAVAEILGGILVIFRKTRALGAIVLFPVILGITLTHIVNEPSGLPIALVFLAIECWIIADNWKRYTPMIS